MYACTYIMKYTNQKQYSHHVLHRRSHELDLKGDLQSLNITC